MGHKNREPRSDLDRLTHRRILQNGSADYAPPRVSSWRMESGQRESIEDFIAGLGIALVAFDLNGRVVLVNPRAGELFGLPREKITSWRSLLRLCDAGTRSEFISATRSCIRLGVSQCFEHDVPSIRGSRWLVMEISPWREGSGEIRGVVISATDVSESHRMTERLEKYAADLEWLVKRRTRDLARSEEKYRDLFNTSPDLYVTIGPYGRIEEVNLTVLSRLGFGREEIVGRRFQCFLDETSRRAVHVAMGNVLEKGQLENFEVQVRRKGEANVECMANAVVVFHEDGSLREVRVVLRDITRRNLMQKQLRQTDRLAATGQLAAGVAHEINNPLQAIFSHLALISDALPEDFSERKSWESLGQAVGRIRQIVADLLYLHRSPQPGRGAIDVNATIKEVLALCETRATHRGIAVSCEFGDGLPPVDAAGRHVYQAILNLVLNAMGVMPHGGVLSLRSRLSADFVQVDVTDTGPGVPEEMLPHIFDPFLTTGGRTGTGLGLFVTYGLVREHGGRIEVDSTPGKGTTFSIGFPAIFESVQSRSDHRGDRCSKDLGRTI